MTALSLASPDKALPGWSWSDLLTARDVFVKSLSHEHKWGCLLCVLPDPIRKEISDWVIENIDDCHLAPEGRELRPHVTCAYGFSQTADQVFPALKPLLARTGSIAARLTGLSLFKGGTDGDVLHCTVDSPGLVELHEAIAGAFSLPGNKYSEYRPHVTLAFLRPDASNLYAEEHPPFLGQVVKLTEAEYSRPDGEREVVPLSFLPQLNLSEKAMSWINPLAGGALVPPPQQGKKEQRGPAAEYCPHCDTRLERGEDGVCNRCGQPWPLTKSLNDPTPDELAVLTGKELIALAASLGYRVTSKAETLRVLTNRHQGLRASRTRGEVIRGTLPPLSPFKSFPGYRTKDRGQPCKQGEAAARTGCIPAQQEPGQQSAGSTQQVLQRQPPAKINSASKKDPHEAPPATVKHREQVEKLSKQEGNRLEVLGDAGKEIYLDPVASGSEEESRQRWKENQPLPMPPGIDAALSEKLGPSWDIVSRLWPEVAGHLKVIRSATPEEAKHLKQATAALDTKTGDLIIPPNSPGVPPEILWHELVHLEQMHRGDLQKEPMHDRDGMTEHGRRMESEAHQRGNMQAAELIRLLLNVPEQIIEEPQEESVGGWGTLSLPGYLTKDRGAPCKPGESAASTGCIPASGSSGREQARTNHQPQAVPGTQGQPPPNAYTVTARIGKAVVEAGYGVPKAKLTALLQSIPEPVRAPVANLWHAVHGILMAGNHAAQALAREVAKGKGLSNEEVEKLGSVLAAVDAAFQGGAMAAAVGTAAVAPAVALAAKAASYLPVASTAYILTSAGRNPVVTAKAAWMLLREKFPGKMKGAAQHAWGSVRHPLTQQTGHKSMESQGRDHAELIAASLASAKDRDWWTALFAAAFDEVQDVAEACRMADEAVDQKFGRPGPSPFGKLLTGYMTKDKGGPCQQGETSAQTGCIPSEGEASAGSGKQPEQQKPKQRRSGEKPKAVRGSMAEAVRQGKGKEAKVILADGNPAPKHITPAMVPPQWVNVQVSTDPKADVLVTGRDAKGRVKVVYSDKFHMRTAAWKFAKTEEGLRKFEQINAENQKNRRHKDPRVREAADCTWLMQEQGTRPGGEADTKGYANLYDQSFEVVGEVTADAKGKKKSTVKLKFEGREIPVRDIGAAEQITQRRQSGEGLEDARYWLQSFGATTLEPRHVVEAEDGVRLQFMGKESVWHDHLIRDPKLAEMLLERKRQATERGGKLFQTDADKLRNYVGTLDGGKFRSKDMRTMLANRLAIKEISGNPDCCRDEKDYKAAVKSVAEKVSGVLGNDPAMALKAYIDPAVWVQWKANCQGCE